MADVCVMQLHNNMNAINLVKLCINNNNIKYYLASRTQKIKEEITFNYFFSNSNSRLLVTGRRVNENDMNAELCFNFESRAHDGSHGNINFDQIFFIKFC